MQKLIFLTFTHLLILNSPVKLPLHKFANTCSCTITQHLQIYKKKKLQTSGFTHANVLQHRA